MSHQFLFGERPLPYFKLPDARGREIVSWDFRQRRPLVIALVHDDSCAICRTWLEQAERRAESIRQCDGELLVVAPSLPERFTQTRMTFYWLVDAQHVLLEKLRAQAIAHTHTPVLIVDRYGEIAEVFEASPHVFPPEEKLLEALEFVERQCPE